MDTKLSGESQAVLLKAALVVGGLYIAYKVAQNGLDNLFGTNGTLIDLAGTGQTLGQGLQHPITALAALFKTDAQLQADIKANNPNGAYLTQNYQNYIDLNGGIDAYTAAHRNGTFKGAPYDANIQYQKPVFKNNVINTIWGSL